MPILSLRVSDEDYDRLRTEALAAGETVSGWARGKLLGSTATPTSARYETLASVVEKQGSRIENLETQIKRAQALLGQKEK